MESGSTRRYLLYAIGEILLVVIGILIALQINNWNEERKRKEKEQEILQALLEDLTVADEQSNQFIRNEEDALDFLEHALGDITKQEVIFSHPSVDSIFYSVIWSFETNVPVINTYVELRNSGQTGFISNLDIRKGFSTLEMSINSLHTLLDDRLTVHQVRIDDLSVNDINFLRLLKAKDPALEIDIGASNNYRSLLESSKVKNLIGIKTEMTSQAITRRKELDEQITSLLQLVVSELK